MIQGTKDLKELSCNSSLIKISLKPPLMNPTTKKIDGVRYETQTYLCTFFSFFLFFCFFFIFLLFFVFVFCFLFFCFVLFFVFFFALNESAYSDHQ